jgi:hypothetical protein
MSTQIPTTPVITMCEQDFILGAGPIGAEFFEKILGMSIDDVLITDESQLSDFSFCGDCDAVSDLSLTLNQAYSLWDSWVLAKIKDEFGLELQSTRITLVTLFAQLEALSNSTRLPH